MRRRLTTAVAILLLVSPNPSLIPLTAQSGNCSECQPPRLNRGYDITPGDLTVCFKSNSLHTWNVDQKNDFQFAFTYWQGVAGSVGKNIPMTFESKAADQDCSANALVVKVVPQSDMTNPDAQAQANGNSTGRGAEIVFNASKLGQVADFRYVGAHEVGHLFDLAHFDIPPFPSHCAGKTPMARIAATDLPTDPCADKLGLTTRYRYPDNIDQGTGYDPKGNDCYDVYMYTYWFWWDYASNTFTYLGWTRVYESEYCGPPPY